MGKPTPPAFGQCENCSEKETTIESENEKERASKKGSEKERDRGIYSKFQQLLASITSGEYYSLSTKFHFADKNIEH